ncbi:MAG: hypothetical protein GY737_09420 [Desulfobacteraceae bacterium]|nr:hypothetical protein [Desulfobacteraceae bacterium]
MTIIENQLSQPPFGGVGVSLAACKRASGTMTLLEFSYPDHSPFLSGFSLSTLYAGLYGYEMQTALGRETRGR